MEQFRKLNLIIGWIIFLISLVVYTLTMEPTVSFWDCGEFISGAYKLEVVHSPGAPFFLILGHLFTMLAPGPESVAWMINFLSALSTAFVVLFWFWSITHLVKKIMIKSDEDYSMENILVILGAGIVGGLSTTFLDTLWFSAVEGEVYALSTFFIALVFWAILRWETIADEKYADRMLVFISLMIGVSIGVHLLSLLAIPTLALVYYFRRYDKADTKGILTAFVAGVAILGFVQVGIVSKFVEVAAGVDKFTVNSLGMGFGIGALAFIGLSILALCALTVYAIKTQKRNLHLAAISVLMILIGYSSYTMVIIRANADTPINMTDPSDPFTLLSYLNREQFGDRPLVYGPQYTAYPIDIKDAGQKWKAGEDKYYAYADKIEYVFDNSEKVFLPRMGSWQDDRHPSHYRAWIQPDYLVVDNGAGGSVVRKFDDLNQARAFAQSGPQGRYQVKDEISYSDNIKFYFKYQLGFMYLRYFLWNFSGRQDDIQGMAQNNNGRWITGIPPIDAIIVGPQGDLPEIDKENRARNKFFLIPLILGIIGLMYQAKHDQNGAIIVASLFLFTGPILNFYFNSPPVEPRERDYTLVGSFITFCIWVGFAVPAIYTMLKQRMGNGQTAAILAICIGMIAPILQAQQGWDDHDRSQRTTAKDFALNYLESVAPNAILFTQGDNDTYPLWYLQEVEGIRTDVRVINLSLLGVDWYINQLRIAANDAPPIDLTLQPDQYDGNKRDIVRYYDTESFDGKRYYDLVSIIEFIGSDNRNKKVTLPNGELQDYLPSKKFKLDIDQNYFSGDAVMPKYRDKVLSTMEWKMGKNNILKNDLIVLDIVASNINKRPVYFAVSVSPSSYMGLGEFLQLEGLAYRIVPVNMKTDEYQTGEVYVERMYDNLMNKFEWGGITDKDVYLDENILRMTANLRSNFGRLAEGYIDQGDKAKAIEVLDKCYELLPNSKVPLDVYTMRFADLYFRAGATDKAVALANEYVDDYAPRLEYYAELSPRYLDMTNVRYAFLIMQEMDRIGQMAQNQALQDKVNGIMNNTQVQSLMMKLQASL